MKTCPNCGSKMDPSVNFCTNCGADIRNVALDEEKQAAATQPAAQPTEAAPSREQMRANTTEPVAAAPVAAPQAKKFDARNMWQWFVNSWKHPFQIQEAERWYGWVTLLVENVLFILGLYIAINKFAGDYTSEAGEYASEAQAVISNFSTSVLLELLLYIVLVIVAMIAAVYFVRKYVYDVNENIFALTNRLVSCSNLSAILYVITFVCLLIGSGDMLKIAGFCFGLAVMIFFLACYAVTVGDDNAVNDKFYGLLIVFVVEILAIWILSKIFGSAVSNQLQDLIHSSTNGMF